MRYYCGCGPRAIKFIVMAIILCAVFGLATMLLWNALIPDLFHGPFLTFWEAVGLLVLSHILFHGCGGRHGAWAHRHWRHRFEEKLAAMTPEEREKFKDEYYHHCCKRDSDKEQDTKK